MKLLASAAIFYYIIKFKATAGLATIFIVECFSFTLHGQIQSLVSTVVMTTTMPYIINHCAKSGGADSIYYLFLLLKKYISNMSYVDGIYISSKYGCCLKAFYDK